MIAFATAVAVSASFQMWILCASMMACTAICNITGIYFLAKDANLENDNFRYNEELIGLNKQKQDLLNENKILVSVMDNIVDNKNEQQNEHSNEYKQFKKYLTNKNNQTEQIIEDNKLSM